MDSSNKYSSNNCNCNGAELPSFSAPYLQYQCPINPGSVDPFSPSANSGDNELLLKDPVSRLRAMQNTLDCALHESNIKREVSKGPVYGRASGAYYLTVQKTLGEGDVRRQYCMESDAVGPFVPPS